MTDTARLLWQGRETLDRIQIIKNSGISKELKPQNTADEGNSLVIPVSPVTLSELPPCLAFYPHFPQAPHIMLYHSGASVPHVPTPRYDLMHHICPL